MSGKLNPATAIFWSKNFDQMSDTTTLEVMPRQTYEDHLQLSQEELRRRIPVYSDPDEE
jgi:hypothetical protein